LSAIIVTIVCCINLYFICFVSYLTLSKPFEAERVATYQPLLLGSPGDTLDSVSGILAVVRSTMQDPQTSLRSEPRRRHSSQP
ncbi:hypothetical protein PMAYCL1PPCAC_31471, partial [Pristionchus mayeri]